MATASASWTDNVSIIAATTVARGSTSRGTIDLRTKFGARVFIRFGRGGTNALSAGVDVLIRALFNNDSASVPTGPHPGAVAQLLTTTAAANSTTVNSNSNSGQAALNVASVSGFAAGDIICVQDSGGGVTRLEWHRVSKTAAGVLTLDRNLDISHTSAQADTVRNKADVFSPIWIPGGSLYELIFDYGSQSTGDTATIEAVAQTYDSDTVA